MKRLLIILYWLSAIFLVSSIVLSMGYRFTESLFIGTLFLPGALAVNYLFPKIKFKKLKNGIIDAAFVLSGTIIAEVLMFTLAHDCIYRLRDATLNIYEWPSPPDLLYNPVFISVVIVILAVGNYFLDLWLTSLLPSKHEPIRFLSDRKPVSLEIDEILFIESNDSVTTVVADGNRRFVNKTPISQWEAFLGDSFIRIHRSYLVNRKAIDRIESNILHLGDFSLPISRKYKDAALGIETRIQ